MSVRPADGNSRQQAYFIAASEAFQVQRDPDDLFPQQEPPIDLEGSALGAGAVARQRFSPPADDQLEWYDVSPAPRTFVSAQENSLGSNIGPRPFPAAGDPMMEVAMLSRKDAFRRMPSGEPSPIEFSGQGAPLHFAEACGELPVIGNEVYHLMRMRRFFKNACPGDLSYKELNVDDDPKPSKVVSRIQVKFDQLPEEIQGQIYLEIACDAGQHGDREFGEKNLFTDFSRFIRATDKLPILQEALRREREEAADASSPEDEEFRPMLAGDRV